MNAYYNDNPDIKSVVDGTNPDCNTCIFAFEGLGEGFGGNSTEHPIEYKYLSAMMVVTKGKSIVYITRRASTLPDNRPDKAPYDDATTTLKEGIYDYYSGYHKNSYAALKPYSSTGIIDWPSWYLNGDENSFHSDTCEAINIHASGQNPQKDKNLANSLGCQTVYTGEYINFGQAVGFIDASVVNDWETAEIKTVTAFLPPKIGPSKNKKIDINIKYVLDRTYDEKNKYYENNVNSNCKNGIFYPIAGTHECITEGEFMCKKC